MSPATPLGVSGSGPSPTQGPHGLGIDADAGRAFFTCEGNAKLLALDLCSIQADFAGEVGKTPDILDLDRALQRLYVAAESGALTVFDHSSGAVRQLLKGEAGPNAHTVAADSAAHHVCLRLQNVQRPSIDARNGC